MANACAAAARSGALAAKVSILSAKAAGAIAA